MGGLTRRYLRWEGEGLTSPLHRGVRGPVASCGVTDAGSPADLLTSPLHDRHAALGATLGAFGGWSMPISYPDGTVAEHTAVRRGVGVFDVSHLGKLSVTGPGAAEFVNRCFTADLGKIGPGQAQYTLCCTADGGVLDDVIVYLVGPRRGAGRAQRRQRRRRSRSCCAPPRRRASRSSTGTASWPCSPCRARASPELVATSCRRP